MQIRIVSIGRESQHETWCLRVRLGAGSRPIFVTIDIFLTMIASGLFDQLEGTVPNAPNQRNWFARVPLF